MHANDKLRSGGQSECTTLRVDGVLSWHPEGEYLFGSHFRERWHCGIRL
jgi:hypothetical protein